MKIGGIILIVFGGLSVIGAVAGFTSEYADRAARSFGLGIGFVILGAYLINRAKKKKEEQKEKDKWNNGN